MDISPITDEQFRRFKDLIYQEAGISLAPQKKALVAGRLAKRLKHYQLQDYGQYYRLLNQPEHSGEFQMMVDLLTTNETYFFREPQHFDFLRDVVLASKRGQDVNIWSAACSSGEEVYTLAMVMAEKLGSGSWRVVGSDISTRMLQSCERAVYPMSRASHMSDYFLRKYCLKGVRDQEGMLLIDRRLRQRCSFRKINLMESLPAIGKFDVIFVRNVMIYFDAPTKAAVVERLVQALKPGGYLITSHSESLHGISDAVRMVKPSIYQKPERAGRS
jgi:chemotaxis protein methyltransferase CheR